MAVQRLFLPLLIIVLAVQWGVAQSGLHRYDKAIEYYFEEEVNDSFRYYINLKLNAAKAADSLECWAQTQITVISYLGLETQPILQEFEKIEKNYWRAPRTSAEARPFFDLESTKAYFLFNAGRIWESIKAYEQADSFFQQYSFQDVNITENVYKALSNHYTRLGDNEKAFAIQQKALDFSQKSGNSESLPGLYTNIGITLWNNKDYQASEDYLRKGLALPILKVRQKALLLGALSTTLLSAGKKKEAENVARASIQLLKSPADPETWYTAANTAITLAAILIDKPGEALPLLSRAQFCAEKRYGNQPNRIFGKIGNLVAEVWIQKQQPKAALAAANTSLSSIMPGFMPSDYLDNPEMSLFYQEVTIAEALQIKAQAFEMLFAQQKDNSMLEKAMECLDLAWKVNRSIRENYVYQSSKLHLQGDWHRWDEMALRLCQTLFEKTNDSRWAERAFQVVERSKAAILLDALKENMALQRLATNDPRFEEIARLRQNIAFLEREFLLDADAKNDLAKQQQADQIRTKIANLESIIRQQYPSLSGQLPDLDGFSNKDALYPGELLLEYFSGSTILHIFVRNAAGQIVAWKQVSQNDELIGIVSRFDAFFADANAISADPAGYFNIAFKLWQHLMPPEARAASRVVVAPDGFVSLIPFDALLTAAATPQSTLKNAPYLIKNQTVRYAWSLSTLYWQQALTPSGKGLLGIAPGFEQSNRGLSPLMNGGKEWAGAGVITALLKDDATSSAFAAQAVRYAVLHLATHAQAGRTPQIEFRDDAFYLADIYAMRLQAELIVLSACETGTGLESKGEGVMSLSRAFACAGARSLIASLWKANDQAAVSIFTAFYENLRQKVSKSDALRNAKLHYLDMDGPAVAKSPWYWAAFSFSGADGPVDLQTSSAQQWLIISGCTLIAMLLYWFYKKRKPR